MIYIERLPIPHSLEKNGDNWLSDYLLSIVNFNENPSKNNKKVKITCENKYKQKDVKASLIKMFDGKCAYCESFLAHISYGHIEHFKPKSIYPNECFVWNNLLLGCEVCNGKQYKSNKFPLADEGGPLVNPTQENPFDFFDFEYDPNSGLANVIGKNSRGILTELTLGLNRPELIKHRSKIVRRIIFVAIKASQGDDHALNEMKKLVEKDEEYSAFSIALCSRFGLNLL